MLPAAKGYLGDSANTMLLLNILLNIIFSFLSNTILAGFRIRQLASAFTLINNNIIEYIHANILYTVYSKCVNNANSC